MSEQPKVDFVSLLHRRESQQVVERAPIAALATPGTATPYAQKALADECEIVASAQEGTRNHALNVAALKLGQLVGADLLDEEVVVDALTDAARRCGLREHEIGPTIRSGLTKGKSQPRVIPDASASFPSPTVLDTSLLNSADDVVEAHGLRELRLTRAAEITPRRVVWLWDGRIALGSLSLLAGREGLGKSTLAYWAAARITRGELPGEFTGQPRAVLVCATEDSWAHTIVPRLMAAGADLELVYRVEVRNLALGVNVGLTLPSDNAQLEAAARQTGAVLLLLDPLMSRLGSLDTHRDAEVRQALEPLTAIAETTGLSVLGLIHHNKSGSSDPLQLVMGSRAFTAVARSVHTVMPDPDDDTGARKLFATPKNNLGRADLPMVSFTIVSHAFETVDGTAYTGRIEWGGEVQGTIGDALARGAGTAEERGAVSEAADWLRDYIDMNGGTAKSADCKRDGAKAGHSERSINRAKAKLGLTHHSVGFPAITWWERPGSQLRQPVAPAVAPNP